jgi:hypothetical protein
MMRREGLWRVGPWFSLVLGPLLFVKALSAPLFRDDLLQRAMALGAYPVPRGPFDLYDFIRPSERAGLVASGALPWWAADDLSLRFFRPLASAILYYEHRLVASPLAMHVHSLLWWAASVVVALVLFRTVLAERAAAIATFVFALAPAHVLSLALLAQREVLLTTTFAVAGIVFLVRPKQSLARSTVCFAIAFAMGEYALCFGGYVAAWAIGRENNRERARAFAPFAGPAIVYLVVRALLGYGAIASGFYRDPFHAPGQFFAHAPRSLIVLWADAWTSFDASSWPWIALAFATVVIVACGWFAKARWLAYGSLLSALPLVATAPEQRLTGPIVIGVAASIGCLVDRALSRPFRVQWSLAALAALVFDVALAARTSWRQSVATHALGENARSKAASLDAELRANDATTVVVALGSWESAFFGLVVASPTTPRTIAWRVLVTARHALVLRTGDRTIDVVVPQGQGFFPLGADDVFRREDDPLHTGDVREVPGMRAEVLSDGNTTPPRVRFTFEHPLGDASYEWISERRDAYRPISPPAVGFGLPLSP